MISELHLSSELAVSSESVADYRGLPDAPGVVALQFSESEIYLGRTKNIRKRLTRLLESAPAGGGRLIERVLQVRYQTSGSAFETSWLLYRTGRIAWPDSYRARLRLRPRPVLKLILNNEFPRTTVTTKLGGSRALYFGPFAARALAEEFEAGILDFFPIRRCVESFEPSPNHPGCVYGEIGKCLQPCREVVSAEEHRAEAGRLLRALHTRGASLEQELQDERDRASEAMEFETAARMHDKLRRWQETMRLPDPAARDLDELHGVVIQRSAKPDAVKLWPVFQGFLQPPVDLKLERESGAAASLDRRVRELFEGAEYQAGSAREREEHLALLERWRLSSWSVGEYVVIDRFDRLPVRKLVNAVSRVYRGVKRSGDFSTAAMRAAERETKTPAE